MEAAATTAAPAPAAPATSAPGAEGGAGAGELNAPAVPVAGEPLRHEILSDEEAAAAAATTSATSAPAAPATTSAASASAPAAPATSAASTAVSGDDGRRQPAHGSLDVESRGGLHTVTWADNWGASFCALAHPKLTKYVYVVFFVGGIAMAMSSRYVEVFSFTRQSVDGYNNDQFSSWRRERSPREPILFPLLHSDVCDNRLDQETTRVQKLLELQLGRAAAGEDLHGGSVSVLGPDPNILIHRALRLFLIIKLIIQLISVTKFMMRANTWQQLNPERRRWLVRPTTILLNFGSFGVIFWLLHENRSNTVEFAIAGITLVLMVIMICIYLKSEVTTGWLALGLMLFYIMAMSWTVIRSVPHRESAKANDPKGPDWLTIVSLCFMAYSTLSIGEDDWLQFNNEEQSEDNIPYGFGYFHLVFALGAMYFGMILVGWNAYQTMQRWTVDFGWWSAIVRAINGFLGAVLYIWMLRTPFIWTKEKLVLSFPEASWVPHATFI